ncbi:MAG TPA: transglycosylase family protein [Candidatus Nanopelagicales bacterium]|nr:transglycosylase family protein [Candidatus Nanopelagicales bacterium]
MVPERARRGRIGARTAITVVAAVAVAGSGWAVAEAAEPAPVAYTTVPGQTVDDSAVPAPSATPTAPAAEAVAAVVYRTQEHVSVSSTATMKRYAAVRVSSPAKARGKAHARATVTVQATAKARAHARTVERAAKKAEAKARTKAQAKADAKAERRATRAAAAKAHAKATKKAAAKAAAKAARRAKVAQSSGDPTMSSAARGSSSARRSVSFSAWRGSDHADMIVWRESNGQCGVVSSNGAWRGAWQMTMTLWRGFGGTAYASTPERASCGQQDQVAYRVWLQQWWTPWGG